jgi:hypothetical protein
MTTFAAPLFDLADAERARDEWGANCGPASLAVVAGMTLDQVRPWLGDFERKGYTNPTLMFDSLRRIGVRWTCTAVQCSSENQGMLAWPAFGLARIQWEGPWTAPGVPIRVRYRHTHWVASMGGEGQVFDVNCMSVGGWVPLSEWSRDVVPWLLKQCEPKASGRWHLTHAVDCELPGRSSP